MRRQDSVHPGLKSIKNWMEVVVALQSLTQNPEFLFSLFETGGREILGEAVFGLFVVY